MLHLQKQATKTPSHIPLRLKASRFRSVISLRESSTSVGGRTRLPPLRMTYRGFIQLFSLATAGCRGAIPYRKILLFIVGATISRPSFVRDMPSFSGAPRRSPTGCFVIFVNLFVFWTVEDAGPYNRFQNFIVGAIHESPVFFRHDRRLFFSGGASSIDGNLSCTYASLREGGGPR